MPLLSVYKSKPFTRFQRRARLSEEDLLKAVRAAENGVIDADLGGGVIKQRIARRGGGKSGGSRSIILFRRGARAVFIYGFEKKDRANITADELETFRELAAVLLGYSDDQMRRQVEAGALLLIDPSKEENAE